jgi:DNA excision repair protein ERCC-2
MLDSAARSVGKLSEKIEEWVLLSLAFALYEILRRIKTTDAAKLQDEYVKLVEGLQEAVDDDNDTFMSNPGKVPLKVVTSRTHRLKFFPTTC